MRENVSVRGLLLFQLGIFLIFFIHFHKVHYIYYILTKKTSWEGEKVHLLSVVILCTYRVL